MTNYKTFRECISDNNNELIIYAADNFPQFPQRDSSVSSKCDRTAICLKTASMSKFRSKFRHF